MTPRWALALGAVLVAIPAAIALGSSRRKRGLGGWDDDDDDDDAPYAGRLAKDEGDCLVLGKKHYRYQGSPYRVCLTPNQKKTLKITKTKKLGCGVFACAYGTRSKDKVVKFTRDSEDVAALLEAQKLGVVPKVYETYKLRDGGHTIETDDEQPVYALVVERLKTFSPSEREALDDDIMRVEDMLYEMRLDPRMSVPEACMSVGIEECGTVVRETAAAAKKLADAGIRWHDIHAGNIGLDKKGRVKILDLGVTGTQLKEQPAILAGARQRLAKRGL